MFLAGVVRTMLLIYYALVPAAQCGAAPPEVDGVLRCEPRQIRGGLGRLVNRQGELRLLFPGCLALAAPLVMFRLKREGFSRCSVQASEQGLHVQGRR